jgi:hypothetical protein
MRVGKVIVYCISLFSLFCSSDFGPGFTIPIPNWSSDQQDSIYVHIYQPISFIPSPGGLGILDMSCFTSVEVHYMIIMPSPLVSGFADPQ